MAKCFITFHFLVLANSKFALTFQIDIKVSLLNFSKNCIAVYSCFYLLQQSLNVEILNSFNFEINKL